MSDTLDTPEDAVGRTAGPLLARQANGGRALFIVIAVMCALACFAALTARGAYRAAEAWSADMRAALTVRVLAPADADAPRRAAEALKRVEGVVDARAMARERTAELLEPWLGEGELPQDIPLPRLVEVETRVGETGVADRARKALADLGVTAEVDDHARWIAEVERATGLVRLGALLSVLLLGGAALAAVSLATRAALGAQEDVVEILHLVGARDSYVAGEVQQAFFLETLKAGAAGAATAGVFAIVLTLLARAGAGFAFGDTALLRIADVWIVLATPLIAAIAAMGTARLNALAVLKATP
jgi:cell division transport system permease protein